MGGLILSGIAAALVTFGWVWAHAEVSHECEKLGAFYVGQTVYKCEKLQDKPANPRSTP